MDVESITTVIGTLGFPIAMCLLMYKQNIDMTATHKEEINSLKESLNNINLAMQKLVDRLDSNNE